MDNASKALIMAGGVLITVMVIGVAMYILSSARGYAYTVNELAEAGAKESFNRYYQSFGGKVLGIDVLNLCSKADDDTARDASIHAVTYSVDDGILSNLKSDEGASSMLSSFNYEYFDTDGDGYIDSLTFTPAG